MPFGTDGASRRKRGKVFPSVRTGSAYMRRQARLRSVEPETRIPAGLSAGTSAKALPRPSGPFLTSVAVRSLFAFAAHRFPTRGEGAVLACNETVRFDAGCSRFAWPSPRASQPRIARPALRCVNRMSAKGERRQAHRRSVSPFHPGTGVSSQSARCAFTRSGASCCTQWEMPGR